MVRLDVSEMARGLSSALAWLEALGLSLRAVLLQAADGATVTTRASRRGVETPTRLVKRLHALGVPLVAFTVNETSRGLLAAADCRVTHVQGENLRNAESKAMSVAVWLAEQPALGLRHSLRLMRSRTSHVEVATMDTARVGG